MNEIIWSMNAKNDTLANLLAYIRNYAAQYFEDTSVEFHSCLPEPLPDIEIRGTVRRQVFLVCKEAFHNIIKHSGATKASFKITITDQILLEIGDDGKGIDKKNVNLYSNGLRSMKERIQNIGGHFEIINEQGAVLHISFPLQEEEL
jgi:signal transduction histidine kinase